MQGRVCMGVRGSGSGPLRVVTCMVVACLGASSWLAPLAHGEPLTFGKTSVGSSRQVAVADHKRVNRYALPTAAVVSSLSVYLEPGWGFGAQAIEGVLYGDSNGVPGALLGVSSPITYASSEPAGWYELVFPTPVEVPAGNYWIGMLSGDTSDVAAYRYDTVNKLKAWNQNEFASGPSNLFGPASWTDEWMSLYATYTPAVPTDSSPPTLAGTAQQGQTLTEQHGVWSGEPTSFTYQWLRCDALGNGCLPIPGATSQIYVPTGEDVGETLRVQESASNEGGASGPVSSAQTAVVLPLAPANTSPPTISGTAQQGSALTAVRGSWSNEPTSFSYQWLRCDGEGNNCGAIPGATSQIYVPTGEDVGETLRVQESASNEGGASGPVSSAQTAVVLPLAPANTSPPTISGTAQQGSTLTAVRGSWRHEPTSFSYQWLRCDGEGNNCGAIPGAGGQSYVPVAQDVGHTLRVQEGASNAGGTSTATSEPTPIVLAGPPPPPPPPSAPKFIASIDTMKLSKDLAGQGFTSADAQAVDLAATVAPTHITVDTPMEYPTVMGQWAERVHGDGKHVWFRLATSNCNQPHGDLGDGYPSYQPGYLTELHQLMLANPGLLRSGDILDGDAEAENSCWWASHYGCGVQSSCTPCNEGATNTPCAPVPQFNSFLVQMTDQENRDLANLGISGVITTVHSTDPGTAQHQLYPSTVRAMGNMITVDAYPDQGTTDPSTAAGAWSSALSGWHQTWLARGIDVSILVGEWGYSNSLAVDDITQAAVIQSEVTLFPTIPYLLGTNYWVGPGRAGAGGYTSIFYQDSAGVWHLRPAANAVASFYASM